MTETVPERIRVVVTEAEVIGPFPPDDDRATDYVPATALEAAQARMRELERERDEANKGWATSQDREIEAFGCVNSARREALEEAAKVADDFPARQCGSLPVDPAACAVAVSMEIAAAIRALMEKPNENG